MHATPSPPVSLSEILRLALPSGSRVVSGEACLGRRIHWARVLGTRTGGLAGVEGGELLILSGALAGSAADVRTLSRLIPEMVAAGATAFLVAGTPPNPLIVACVANDVPLLAVPDATALAEVERAIIGLILDRDAQVRRRAEEVHGKLLAAMLGNAGLPALLAALGEATGLAAAVFDDYLALQACVPEDEEFRAAVLEVAGNIFSREAGSGFQRPVRPLRFDLRHRGAALSGHLHPLEIGAARAGYLGLVGPVGEADELDRLLAERVATLVTIELAKQRTIAEALQRGRGELLADLLDGSFPNTEAVLARGHQLGYDLLAPHLIFALAPDGAGLSGQAPPSRTRPRRRFAEVGRATIVRLHPRALVVEREHGLVVLVPVARAGDAEPLAELVERVRVEVAGTIGGGVSAGLGRALTAPDEVDVCHREAAQALTIAQRLLGGGRTVHYGRAGIERLLVHLLDNPELERFATDALGQLLAYDQSHRGELVHTLDVFLRCNGNHVRAAEQLHLHRNTLLYRLDRARAILGRELEDADTRLALQVALRIRGVLPAEATARLEPPTRVVARRRRAG